MNLFWYTTAAVSAGFVAGASWLWLKDTMSEGDYHWTDDMSREDIEDVVARLTELQDENLELTYVLYAIDLKAEEYAATKHTVYRKCARDLRVILYPATVSDDD